MFRVSIFGGRNGINLGLRRAMPPTFEKKKSTSIYISTKILLKSFLVWLSHEHQEKPLAKHLDNLQI